MALISADQQKGSKMKKSRIVGLVGLVLIVLLVVFFALFRADQATRDRIDGGESQTAEEFVDENQGSIQALSQSFETFFSNLFGSGGTIDQQLDGTSSAADQMFDDNMGQGGLMSSSIFGDDGIYDPNYQNSPTYNSYNSNPNLPGANGNPYGQVPSSNAGNSQASYDAQLNQLLNDAQALQAANQQQIDIYDPDGAVINAIMNQMSSQMATAIVQGQSNQNAQLYNSLATDIEISQEAFEQLVALAALQVYLNDIINNLNAQIAQVQQNALQNIALVGQIQTEMWIRQMQAQMEIAMAYFLVRSNQPVQFATPTQQGNQASEFDDLANSPYGAFLNRVVSLFDISNPNRQPGVAAVGKPTIAVNIGAFSGRLLEVDTNTSNQTNINQDLQVDVDVDFRVCVSDYAGFNPVIEEEVYTACDPVGPVITLTQDDLAVGYVTDPSTNEPGPAIFELNQEYNELDMIGIVYRDSRGSTPEQMQSWKGLPFSAYMSDLNTSADDLKDEVAKRKQELAQQGDQQWFFFDYSSGTPVESPNYPNEGDCIDAAIAAAGGGDNNTIANLICYLRNQMYDFDVSLNMNNIAVSDPVLGKVTITISEIVYQLAHNGGDPKPGIVMLEVFDPTEELDKQLVDQYVLPQHGVKNDAPPYPETETITDYDIKDLVPGKKYEFLVQGMSATPIPGSLVPFFEFTPYAFYTYIVPDGDDTTIDLEGGVIRTNANFIDGLDGGGGTIASWREGLIQCGKDPMNPCDFNDIIEHIQRFFKLAFALITPFAAIAFMFTGIRVLVNRNNSGKKAMVKEAFMNVVGAVIILMLAWFAIATFFRLLGIDNAYVLLDL